MASRNYVFTLSADCIKNALPLDEEDDTEEVCIYWGGDNDKFSPDNIPRTIAGKPFIKYCVMQLEKAPSTNSLHFQGYIELNESVRITGVKSNIWWLVPAHLETRRGTRDEARDYCRKENTRVAGPWEWGEWEKSQGYRSDLASLQSMLVSGASAKDIALEMPAMFVRHHAGIRAFIDVTTEVPKDPEFVPRPWQAKILDIIKTEPNDRNIYWVTDSVGNTGKSRLTRHLICEHKAISLSGQVKDMMHAYSNALSPIVIFDISRAAEEYSAHLYTMAESLKNGQFFSTKYNSKMLLFKPPHVIFFSNHMWDRTKFSADRVIHIDLDNFNNQQQALRFM